MARQGWGAGMAWLDPASTARAPPAPPPALHPHLHVSAWPPESPVPCAHPGDSGASAQPPPPPPLMHAWIWNWIWFPELSLVSIPTSHGRSAPDA
ncbi:hypothetical protein PCL_01759 [Purpureocillium lilacinum]|uniref:Uncharacterized protein n=1 Tax=Purpureocillium lilacinum TaxID=33203 RepID=A0A2U3E2E5_PURLI|nr:hypothetical protein PCL_01759 [Purpureocillium lilacinum]